MYYKNYNLLTLLLVLFFCHTNAQENCTNGNFEQLNLPNNYVMETAVNADTQGCSTTTVQNLAIYTFPSGFPPLNNATSSVSFVSTQNEPTLAGFGQPHPQVDGSTYALRLNARSTKVIEENTTVLTRDLGIITERYLKINYSAVFHVPDHSNNLNFVKFSVINKSTGLVIAERCLDSNDTNGIDNSNSSDDLITVNASDPFNTWRYNDWSCLSFDLNKYVGKKSNLELRIIAADCGEAFHDTLLYIDDICFDENSCECIDGNISMNTISKNCPTKPFSISGNYTLPSCDAIDPTNIVLTLVPFNPNTGNSGTPITINQNDFSNGNYSFNFNPSNLNTSLEYDLIATANFSDGSSWSVSNPGREITFIDCADDCDYWVAILDEYIDGTQSGSNYVYLMANGTYPSGSTYNWTTIRQSGLVQTYTTTNDIVLVSASINNRITSATVTVSYGDCSETVNKTFACAIPNSDANGNLFPECKGNGGGTGFGKKSDLIKLSPNPIQPNENLKINGIESVKVKKIEVLDLFGNIKSTHQLKSDTLRVGNLKPGIYFIKIHTKEGIKQKKFIVK